MAAATDGNRSAYHDSLQPDVNYINQSMNHNPPPTNQSFMNRNPTPNPTASTHSASSDVLKCCVCLAPTPHILTLPACLHAFCSPCFERIRASPRPDSCPICLAEGQCCEGVASYYCALCSRPSAPLCAQCVHCEGYLCEECAGEHAARRGCETHVTLALSHPALAGFAWRSAEPVVAAADAGWYTDWPCDAIGRGEKWLNPPLSDHSWANSTTGSTEKLWSANGSNKWVPMHSTVKKNWGGVSGAGNGGSFDPNRPPMVHADDDSDSLMYECGGDSTDYTSSSAEPQSLSNGLTSSKSSAGSLYDPPTTNQRSRGFGPVGSDGPYKKIITEQNASKQNGFGLSDLAAVPGWCARHEVAPFTHYCKSCEAGVCESCAGDACAAHDISRLDDRARHDCIELLAMRERSRGKAEELVAATAAADEAASRLRVRYRDDERAIREAFDFFLKALLDRRAEMNADLQAAYGDAVDRLGAAKEEALYNVQQLTEACELIRTLLLLLGGSGGTSSGSAVGGGVGEIYAKLRETVGAMLSYNMDMRDCGEDILFVANHQAVQAAIRNAFGYIRGTPSRLPALTCSASTGTIGGVHPLKKVFSAAELTTSVSPNNPDAYSTTLSTLSRGTSLNHLAPPYEARNGGGFPALLRGSSFDLRSRMPSGGYGSMPQLIGRNGFESATASSQFGNGGGGEPAFGFGGELQARKMSLPVGLSAGGVGGLGGMAGSLGGGVGGGLGGGGVNLYENRTTAMRNGFSIISVDSEDEMSKVIMPTICPSEFKRRKMEYHCKFGEFGSESNQFYEPSGVAVTTDNDILVADANNHRIQAFDKNGTYLRTIGQDHRGSEGDLVYPNRLTVNRTTGDIIVTERSPTHQVNVYNRDGRFVRKFGASILQHPRGITVDNLGRIIVVECKVMRVVIFSVGGSVLNRFIVDKHVNFPNGVAVNDREEIFISDNRRHGVVVFDYHGSFLRTVGGMGITNYPIGVGINIAGEVVIADNHNNFNVTVFTQEGVPLRALESRVKHAQCFDIALLDRGSIVLSSKDFRVYVYQYAPCGGVNGASG